MLHNGDKIEYIIDGKNRRIGRIINGVITNRWIYSGQLYPVAEIDNTGNIVSTFNGSYIEKSAVIYRVIRDHLGSIRIVVNLQTGEIVQRIEYDEWGDVIYDSNPGFQPFGYAGGIYDVQTGLTRFGVRDYDSKTGRWTCKDPIVFEGGDGNLFAYVGNEPINWIDSYGLDRYIQSKPAGPGGPIITFVNDEPGGPSTNQEVSDATAEMIENAVIETGFDININSSTGGIHDPNSRHPLGQALDINRVNCKSVRSGNEDARRLQEVLNKQPNIRENYGPFINTKTNSEGNIFSRPDQAAHHMTHIHISGQR